MKKIADCCGIKKNLSTHVGRHTFSTVVALANNVSRENVQKQVIEMTEFWDAAFREKNEMWGFDPCDSAIMTLDLFREWGINKVLIPGFGYGRNAQVFIDKGFDVTGIEISETAITLAKKHYGQELKVYRGFVTDMPFEDELYDGIFVMH